jgi:integrase
MFKLAYEERKIQSLPVIRLLKEPPARRRFLELPKFEELLAQFPPNLKPYITFLYFCGGRSGEAELVEWSQVDLQRKLIRIEDDQTKDKQAREIPLPRLDAGKNRTETGPCIRHNQHPQGMDKDKAGRTIRGMKL